MKVSEKLILLFFLLILVALNASDAQVNFRNNQYLPYLYNPKQIIESDFNLDGNVDIATCNDGTFSIILNEDGQFNNITNFQVSPFALFYITAGDFNNDLAPDLAVSFNADSISILLNSGTGTFTKDTSYRVGTAPVSMVSADFNKDGKADLAVVNSFSKNVYILINSETGFTAPQIHTIGHGYRIKQGDFNNDTYTDLIISNNDEHNVCTLINKGNGTFEDPVYFTTNDYPTNISVFDYNEDNFPDFVLSYGLSKIVSLYKNTGNGFELVKDLTTTDTGNLTNTTTGDFNNDGLIDIAALDYDNGNTHIFLNSTSHEFDLSTTQSVGIQPQDIIAGDFIKDGKPDMATISVIGELNVLYNQGNNQFQQQNFGPGYAISLAKGDFNGDGSNDLAYANLNTKSISILLNDSNGNFTSMTNYNAGSSPSCIKVGQLNTDNFQDLVVANSEDNTVSIYYGKGDGSFNIPFTYSVGAYPLEIAIVDLDQDDKNDLVVVNEKGNSLSILLNTGNTFAATTNVNVSSHPFVVSAGNLNDDNFLDLLVAYQYPNSGTNILLGNGDGTFESLLSFNSTRYQSILIDDFTADNLQDIAATVGNQLLIYPRTGNVEFSDPIGYNIASDSRKIIRGDFDADGKLDIATISPPGNSVSVLLAQENGTFSTYFNFPVKQTPFDIIEGDVNNDDKDDLVLAGWPSFYVTVLISLPKLTITANNATKEYGSPNPEFTGTAIGLIENDQVDLSYTTLANVKSQRGEYLITPVPSPYALENYAVVINNGILTVTRAPLTITGKDAVRIVGAENPNFSSTFDGLKNDDVINVGYVTTANFESPIGEYPIEQFVLSDGDNYNITLINGTLTILPVTGIETSSSGQFALYPNPGNGNFIIDNPFPHAIDYEITEMNGRIILKGNLVSGINQIRFERGSGLFLVKLANGTVFKLKND